MDVSSAIEIYTAVLGWVLYDGIWKNLEDIGLLYVPLVIAIVKNWMTAYRVQGHEGAESTLRNNWLDIGVMMTVIAAAGVPVFSLSIGDLSHTTPCGGSTVAGGSTGTLYDRAFAALNGKIAKVPFWWYGIDAVANGLNNATIALIPCSPDLRTLEYRIDNARISDPELRRQLELFTRDCWQKARAKFMAGHTVMPTSYAADDIDWIGSSFFRNTDTFYGHNNINLSMRASEEIPGFAYVAARDTEYAPGFIPAWGRPECKDWWENVQSGIQPRLMALVDSEAITQAITETGDMDTAKNVLLRKILEPEKPAFGRLLAINSYGNAFGDDLNLVNGAAGTAAMVGLGWESAFWKPKIYALRQAAPIGQSFILMGITVFLPFVLLFSGYSLEVLLTTTVAIVAIKFLTPIWTLAVWIDNHMMEALGLKWYSWLNLEAEKAPVMLILNLVAMLMFVVLPIVWFMVIGWAGVHISKTMDTFNGISNPIQGGAGSPGKASGLMPKPMNLGNSEKPKSPPRYY